MGIKNDIINLFTKKKKDIPHLRPCINCKFGQTNIPCGICTHPDNYFCPLNDMAWFNNRPANCPLNKF